MKTFAIFIFILLAPATSFAHPRNTDSKGGHTCKTNCPKWGLSYGQYHYHTKKPAAVTAPAPVKQKVYVKGYYRKDGTYVQGYWRNQ